MQNLSNLNNLNALGIKGGGLFNPASISVNGERTLLQQVLTKRTPTIGGIVYDERKNKGTARSIQTGRAYDFDGTNDYVDYGNIASIASHTGPFSVMCWINDDNVLTAYSMYFSKATGVDIQFALRHTSTVGSLRFEANIGGLLKVADSPVSTLVNGVTYHIAGVYDGSNIILYLDGVAIVTTPATGLVNVNSVPVNIGRRHTDGFYTNGRIWDARYYNSALTPAEVLSCSKNNNITPRPIFWAKCDEQQGITSLDSSGNGNHGTIINASLPAFHTTQNVYSFQNEIGYSNNSFVKTGTDSWSDSLIRATAPMTGDCSLEFVTTNRGFRYVGLVENNDFQTTFSTSPHKSWSFYPTDTTTLYIYYQSTLKYTGTYAIGDKLRMNRVGSTMLFYKNDVLIYTGDVASDNLPLYLLSTIYTQNSRVDDLRMNGQIATYLLSGAKAPSITYVPRNESDTTKNIFNNTLQYSGGVPYDADLEQSNCVDFDGTNQYGTVTGSPVSSYTGAFSISVKFNADVLVSGSPRLISTRTGANGIDLYVSTANIFYYNGITQTSITQALSIGTDYTITFTCDGTNTKTYLNGVLIDTRVWSFGIVGGALQIGRYSASSNYLNGRVWDIRTFSRVLTDAEALAIHNGENITSNLDLHLPMAEGAGSVIYDISGNDYHGALFNAPSWGKQNLYHYNIAKGFTKYNVLNSNGGTIWAMGGYSQSIYSGDFTLRYKATELTGYAFIYTSEVTTINNPSLLSDDWYGIYQRQAELRTDSSSDAELSHGALTVGDIIEIRRIGSEVKWYKNDVLIRTSALASSVDMYVCTSLHSAYSESGIIAMNGTPVSFNVASSTQNKTYYIPAISDTEDVLGNPLYNQAGAYHNGAETLIDFTSNVLSPEAVRNSWETAWAFNTARTNPEFKRTLTSGGVDHRADRFLAYRDELTGSNLSKVNKYVTTKAI